MFDLRRVRFLHAGRKKVGPVVYWMSRDQRMRDNHALLYAIERANAYEVPVLVVFCLAKKFLGATLRQYDFMLKGLREVSDDLKSHEIPFFVLCGDPVSELAEFVLEKDVCEVICDFSSLRISHKWKRDFIKKADVSLYEVDTHNIVPCWLASNKQEFAARTFRPKIKERLMEFLSPVPRFKKPEVKYKGRQLKINWKELYKQIDVDEKVGPVDWLKPGEREAAKVLKNFINKRLKGYDSGRNDPTKQVCSNLSPYLHFGQISAHKVALEVIAAKASNNDKDAFLEELVVRKELSDNFCFYNESYDSFNGFPDWAKKTLNKHKKDKRRYLYSRMQFEKARTHDDLWNAAQMEMVKRGKMHGYMRMYWAKKILEWTKDAEEALKIAIYLNDKYELDGRDPSGYVGVSWSMGGVHDRPWKERKIFGMIRYMNRNGCERKFDVQAYIDWVNSL